MINNDHGKPAEESGLKPAVPITWFITMDRTQLKWDTASFYGRLDDASVPFQRQTHKNFLAHNKGLGLLAICTGAIVQEMKSHAYPYTF